MSANLTLSGHADVVSAVAWLGAERVVTGSFDKTIKIWNVATATAEKTLPVHQDQVLALAAAAGGNLFASGGKDRQVKLWNSNSFDAAKDIANHSKGVHSVAFSADGKLGAWEPDCINLQLPLPKITTRELSLHARQNDIMSFIKEHRRINPGLSIEEAKTDFARFRDILDNRG